MAASLSMASLANESGAASSLISDEYQHRENRGIGSERQTAYLAAPAEHARVSSLRICRKTSRTQTLFAHFHRAAHTHLTRCRVPLGSAIGGSVLHSAAVRHRRIVCTLVLDVVPLPQMTRSHAITTHLNSRDLYGSARWRGGLSG